MISCELPDSMEDNTPLPDPTGTITTNLSGYAALIVYQGASGDLYLGMNVPAVNVLIYLWDGFNNH